MKRQLFITLALVTALLPACRNRNSAEVVKVTYMHKYGVPVTESDWHKQGQEGQIVSFTSDGVTITKSYHEGALHGEATYTYPNSSTLQYKEVYREGTLASRTETYPSGTPYLEECFEKGERSKVTQWYEQGTPHSIEHYHKGSLTQGEYRNLANEVESRVQEGEGIRLIRGNEGELSAKERIEGGARVEQITFYLNGEPKSITPFVNNLVHGKRLTFFSGAIPHTVEQWVEGQQEGITLLFQNGEKIAAIPYVNGKREGISYSFRNEDQVAEEVTWRADKMHGKRTLFVEEGINKVEWYIDGELVSKPTFDRLNPIR